VEDRFKEIIHQIRTKTISQNRDNISRTVSYANFFKRNPEIRWSLLASMVSRNAGYSMCDLKGEWFPRILTADTRKHLFMTYERANWLIFQDAYPQLLLYEISKKERVPFFDLLNHFQVSKFMTQEWHRFWEEKDISRLVVSLIINEQHVIDEPILKHSFYKHRIFSAVPFLIQDYMHFSTVLFPTLSGDVFGISVHGFKTVKNRIETGKLLYWILFESPWSEEIIRYSNTVTHTGSRHDFERYVYPNKHRETPYLRTVYPFVSHNKQISKDWFINSKFLKKFYKPVKPIKTICLTDWYKQKQRQMKIAVLAKEWIQNT
jgi:hypothetical protein